MRRFIDRCYTEKTANLFLESCRDWMNKINEGREYYSEEFKEQQFLIFAGMLSYYGYEYLDEIVEVFKETEFFYVEIDYEDFKKENPEFSLQFAENPIALTRRAVCLELFPLRLALDNTIWLFVQNNYSKRDWLEIVIHEVNHIVNSVNSSLRVRGFDVIGRTGCALFSNKYAAKNGDIFEESINVLQTAEVMNHILGFYNFNIYDDEIRSIFDKYRDESFNKSEGIGYNLSVPHIRKLYNIPRFREILFDVRMNGNLKEIETYFDGLLYDGAYDDLLGATDKFYFCSDEEDRKKGSEKVKELVKMYKSKI